MLRSTLKIHVQLRIVSYLIHWQQMVEKIWLLIMENKSIRRDTMCLRTSVINSTHYEQIKLYVELKLKPIIL